MISSYSLYAKFILIMAFVLNTWKFLPMILYQSGLVLHYYVFPWQGRHGQVSRSRGEWLCIHLAVSLCHIFQTYDLIYPIKCCRLSIDAKFYTKLAFELIIAINVWNFGESSYLVSTLINGGLLLLSRTFYESNTKLYYFLITLPILLEVIVSSTYLLRTYIF